MTWEVAGAIAGIIGAVAAVVACFQAAMAKQHALEVKVKVEALHLQLTQVNANISSFTNSPIAHLVGSRVTIPGASGGAGGSGGTGGGGAGGGGGSVFGHGGSGGGTSS